MIYAIRSHEIACGHKVYGHESKCQHLHGHNYIFHFSLTADELDPLGRILDFGTIKQLICQWLEAELDHRFLVFDQDPDSQTLQIIDPKVVITPFNPTAENIARWLGETICPALLVGDYSHIQCNEIKLFETSKCYVRWIKN